MTHLKIFTTWRRLSKPGGCSQLFPEAVKRKQCNGYAFSRAWTPMLVTMTVYQDNHTSRHRSTCGLLTQAFPRALNGLLWLCSCTLRMITCASGRDFRFSTMCLPHVVSTNVQLVCVFVKHQQKFTNSMPSAGEILVVCSTVIKLADNHFTV